MCGRGTLGHHQPGPQQQQMAFLEEPKREKPQPALCWGHDGRAQGQRWPGEKESHATPWPEGSEPCRRRSIRTFGPPTHTAPPSGNTWRHFWLSYWEVGAQDGPTQSSWLSVRLNPAPPLRLNFPKERSFLVLRELSVHHN